MTDEQPSLRDARALLGVTADATRAQVVSAFRHRARSQHPDISHTRGAAARFAALVAAYRVVLRAAHDDGGVDLAAQGRAPVAAHPTSRRRHHVVADPRETTPWGPARPMLLIGPVVVHRSPARGGGRRDAEGLAGE